MAASRLQLASRIQFLLQRKMHLHMDVTEMLINPDYAARMLAHCREAGLPEAEDLATGFEAASLHARRVPGLPVPQAPSIPVQPSVLRRPGLHVRGADLAPAAKVAMLRPVDVLVQRSAGAAALATAPVANVSPAGRLADATVAATPTADTAVASISAALEAREARRRAGEAETSWWGFTPGGLAGA